MIFVTAFDHYGIQAIKFAALDYLLKPLDIDELTQAVKKVKEKLNRHQHNQQVDLLLNHVKKDALRPAKIALPQHKEIRYVQVSQIVRCEADGSYTSFYLADDDTILVSKSLKEYAGLLQPHGFIRTHQSHLVNSVYVKSWLKEDGGIVLLTTHERIPVSKLNREKVKAILASSMG